MRTKLARGITRFFITDDDLARNKNWEAIFDRLIALREREGWIHLKLMIQVDTQCHKVPRFIEKAVRAGCTRVFIGLESVNPENLAASAEAPEPRRRIPDDAAGLAVARRADPGRLHRGLSRRHARVDRARHPDHPARAARRYPRILHDDARCPARPTIGTSTSPGKWLEPDLNRYDTEHAAAEHPRMTRRGMEGDLRPGLAPVLQSRARGDAPASGTGRRHPDQAPGGGDLHLLRQLSLRERPPAPVRRLSAQGPPHAPAGCPSGTPAAVLSTTSLGDRQHLRPRGALLPLAAAAQAESSSATRRRLRTPMRRSLDSTGARWAAVTRSGYSTAIRSKHRIGQSGTRRHWLSWNIAPRREPRQRGDIGRLWPSPWRQTAIGRQNSNVEWGNGKKRISDKKHKSTRPSSATLKPPAVATSQAVLQQTPPSFSS